MNGVSNNMAVKQPNYKATRNGAIAGAVTAGTLLSAGVGLMKIPQLVAKNASFAEKREIISNGIDSFTKLGFDMSKNTVSKSLKSIISFATKPAVVAKSVGFWALAGAGIGLAVDLIKNNKIKKENAKIANEQ